MISEQHKIYSFLDYRRYLKAYYDYSKDHDPTFSYRAFSRQVGVKAPNFLQWLIEGNRNLAKKTIAKVASAMQLDPKEEEYFTALVHFNQSKTINEKTRFFEKLMELYPAVTATALTQAQYQHYANWYNEAIRELLNYYRLDPDEKWAFRKLARMLRPEITESQARTSLKQLMQLGLVKKRNDGRFRLVDEFITTGDEAKNFFIQKYHEAMITIARESMDRFPSEIRDISSVTMSISDECFTLIKKEVQQMRKRVLELVKMDTNPNNVYQLNFQLFPLVKKTPARVSRVNNDHAHP
ncbi:MAG: TIGR02147 family protein [Chitinispirillaceae bacterium]|jgi:uncharacterized protein (TIGR02147 family)